LLAAFPAALLFRAIPRGAPPAVRHTFSIIMSGTLFCALFNPPGFAQLLSASFAVWLAAKSFQSHRWMPLAVFAFSMGGLSANHIVGQIINGANDHFDHTAPMMVLVIKLTSYAWSAYDGAQPEENLSEDKRKLAIRELPGLVEFLGYVLFFPTFLVGPSFEFSDYKRFIDNKAPFNNRPSSLVPTLKATGAALICLVLFFKFGNTWTYHYTLTPEFLELSLWSRVLFMQVAGGIARSKYYIAWKLAEASCDLAGLGFNGYDTKGSPQWDRVRCIAIRKFEFSTNPKLGFEYWNQATGLWLRRYVYVRITDAGFKSSAVAMICTYVTSSFWHGFRPGFYLTFLTGSFLNISGRTLRRNVRPLFLGASKLAPFKPVYDVLGWACTIGGINYLVAPFVVHSVRNSLFVWKRNYFMLHVGIAVIQIGYGYLGFDRITRNLGKRIGATYPEPHVAKAKAKVSHRVGDIAAEAGAPAVNISWAGSAKTD
ncbi:lysophospholipid acyltransferase, partial [Thoreauomyces humboldtii]